MYVYLRTGVVMFDVYELRSCIGDTDWHKRLWRRSSPYPQVSSNETQRWTL